MERAQVLFNRIRIEKDVRRLHQKAFLVARKIAHGLAQEIAEGRVVGIEHDDDFATRHRKRIVHITGFGVLVLFAREIDRAHLRAQSFQFLAPLAGGLGFLEVGIVALLVGAAVVEQPYGQFVIGIIHRPRCGHGGGQNVFVLVIGRDEHVYGGQLVVGIALDGGALQRIGADREADDKDQHAIAFGRQQQDAERKAHWITAGRQRARGAPVEIANDDEAAETDKQLTIQEPGAEFPHDGHHDDDRQAQSQLSIDANGLAQQQKSSQSGNDPCSRAQCGSHLKKPQRTSLRYANLV